MLESSDLGEPFAVCGWDQAVRQGGPCCAAEWLARSQSDVCGYSHQMVASAGSLSVVTMLVSAAETASDGAGAVTSQVASKIGERFFRSVAGEVAGRVVLDGVPLRESSLTHVQRIWQ